MKIATEQTLYEAAAAHREPFIFHRGEVTESLRNSLAREYKNFGKPILLAPRGLSGVYPKETNWLIPKGVGPEWIRKHLAPLVAETKVFDQAICPHCGTLVDIGDAGD